MNEIEFFLRDYMQPTNPSEPNEYWSVVCKQRKNKRSLLVEGLLAENKKESPTAAIVRHQKEETEFGLLSVGTTKKKTSGSWNIYTVVWEKKGNFYLWINTGTIHILV